MRKGATPSSENPVQSGEFAFGGLHWLLGAVVSTVPALVAGLLIYTTPGVEITNYTPQWSDEVYNWHQVATFGAVGFDGGYYTANERPAPISLIHFYAHGPIYPMLLGAISRVIGWDYYTAPIVNIALVTLAIFFFVGMARPGFVQLLLLGLILATCWPLHLYMITDMRLAYFMAVAIFLAGFFSRTLADPGRSSPFFLGLFAVAIALASVSKLTFSFLFFPYFLHLRQRLSLNLLQALGVSCLLVVMSFVFYNQVAAPYSNVASDLLMRFERSLVDGIAGVAEHAWVSLGHFFGSDNRALWLMLRLQMVVTVLWAGFLVWRRRDHESELRESYVILAGSGSLILLTILLYDVFAWRDYRLFGPALLLCTLVIIDRKRWVLVVLLIVGNLAVLPDFIAAHEQVFFKDRFSSENRRLEEFIEQISPIIQYDADKNGWENTILVPQFVAENPLLIGIPRGIGISWFHSARRLPRVKSRYAILDLPSYTVLRQRSRLNFVRKTTLGDLYINLTPDRGD
jgi:hypothetical protein